MNNVLPWHAEAWARLQKQIADNRMPHAILLEGPAGSGRRQFVDALCASLICEQQDGKPCGHCKQCRLYISGNAPDLQIIEPADDSKAIRIDQVRQAIEFTRQTSNQTGVIKLVVFRPVEAINVQAANSLLKTLEEPPGKTLIILVAESGRTLLPTIRSRCQVVALSSAPVQQAMQWLQQHSSASATELQAALALTPGCPFAALTLLEQGVVAWRAEMNTQLRELADKRTTAVAVAKLASAQPALHAINFMEEHSADNSRRFAKAQQFGALRKELDFQKKLVPLKRQLGITANPNELLLLEYVFAQYAALSDGLDGN